MKKIIKSFVLFGNEIKKDNINAYASSCAFFIFMSLFPLIILMCSVLPFTPITEGNIISFLQTNIKGQVGELLILTVNEFYEKSVGVVSVSAIAAFWAAGKGINSLVTGLNAIEHYEDKRNSLIVRFMSCLYTLIFLFSILLFLIVMVYGPLIVNVICGYFPALNDLFGLLLKLRSLFFLAFMSVVFIIVYAMLPCRKRKFREQIPGAFITSFLWTIFSYLFSIYVENFNAFSMYGSFTTIIILLFWLYICMSIVLLGANINKYLRPFIVLFTKKRRLRSELKHQRESLEE